MTSSEARFDVEKLSVSYTSLLKRALVSRQAEASIRSLDVEFIARFPESAAKEGRNLKKDVMKTVRKTSKSFKSEVLPGLKIDKKSIRVNAVQLVNAPNPEEVRTNVNVFILGIGVILVAIVGTAGITARSFRSRKKRPVIYNEHVYGQTPMMFDEWNHVRSPSPAGQSIRHY